MKQIAKTHGIWIIFGMNEKAEDPGDDRNYNTTVVINADGKTEAVYRKTHLYDAFGYMESADYLPGDRLFQPIDTPFGRIGLFVCYEVRFPEVARCQRKYGADIIVMPAAWTRGPLKSHQFRTLVTARAVENTVYLAACDLCAGYAAGPASAVAVAPADRRAGRNSCKAPPPGGRTRGRSKTGHGAARTFPAAADGARRPASPGTRR